VATLLLATTNPGKLREMRALLSGLDVELLSLADVPAVPEPAETGETYWENARIKALAYAGATGRITVAEDSGLEIAALGGEPGVRSARFMGADTPYPVRFEEIFRRLWRSGQQRADGRFVTALAVARGTEILFETTASVDGVIAPAPAGAGGFGYDPIFLYPPFGRTLADCSDTEKGIVSHRGRAFRTFVHWLRAHPDGLASGD
jgi:XTP/dITP diphosphohydrolase